MGSQKSRNHELRLGVDAELSMNRCAKADGHMDKLHKVTAYKDRFSHADVLPGP